MTAVSDLDLIEQVLQSNKPDAMRAYALLVDRYKNMVFTLSMRMLKNKEDAEETAQDIFMKAYKSLSSFKGNSKFSTWIYKIAYNTCLDKLRSNKNKYITDVIDEINESKITTTENAFDTLESKEQQQIIKNCLELLPGDDGFLLTLFYYDDLSVAEVATTMGTNANNVKIKLHRARKKLAEILRTKLETETIERYENTR